MHLFFLKCFIYIYFLKKIIIINLGNLWILIYFLKLLTKKKFWVNRTFFILKANLPNILYYN